MGPGKGIFVKPTPDALARYVKRVTVSSNGLAGRGLA